MTDSIALTIALGAVAIVLILIMLFLHKSAVAQLRKARVRRDEFERYVIACMEFCAGFSVEELEQAGVGGLQIMTDALRAFADIPIKGGGLSDDYAYDSDVAKAHITPEMINDARFALEPFIEKEGGE